MTCTKRSAIRNHYNIETVKFTERNTPGEVRFNFQTKTQWQYSVNQVLK